MEDLVFFAYVSVIIFISINKCAACQWTCGTYFVFFPYVYVIIISMLLVSRSMDLWKIPCISCLCSCDNYYLYY